MRLQRAERIRGTLRVPGDKSIAHRALIIGSVAKGKQVIEGIPAARDVQSTMSCLRALGTFIEEMPDGRVLVLAKDFARGVALDAGNSGTTARLLSGLLAGYPIETTIDGDASLRKRPMERIAEPLETMGAGIESSDGRLPMTIRGGRLRGIHYRLPVPSAQVKSAILLAALRAEGETVIEEPIATRDHTERMFAAMSVPIEGDAGRIVIRGGSIPKAGRVSVPGDVSSAAFFVVAALCLDDSELYLPALGVNNTRTGLFRALARMGGTIEYFNRDVFLEEPIADIAVESSQLSAVTIDRREIPSMIDELPVLAVAATQANGETIVRGAEELRYKESDRIAAIVDNLTKMGADIAPRDDGFVARGPTALRGARVSSHGDHRIAMATAIAALLADGRTEIEDSDVIGVSYPDFFNDLLSISQIVIGD